MLEEYDLKPDMSKEDASKIVKFFFYLTVLVGAIFLITFIMENL